MSTALVKVDSSISPAAGFFVVDHPGTIVRTESGTAIGQSGFAEYLLGTRKAAKINGTFDTEVTLRGRIRYPASTTLVSTRPVTLGTGNGTVTKPTPVGGASPEFFEAVYSKPAGAANGSWFLLGDKSKFVKKVAATVAGGSVTWKLDEAGKFTGAVITEGATPFVTGDRVYFTITREPLGTSRPVIFVVHGNHGPRLASEPFFVDTGAGAPDPSRDLNLVILKTSDTPLSFQYRVDFDAATGKWNVFRGRIRTGAFAAHGPAAEFDKEYTTADGHVTFLMKSYAAAAGHRYFFGTSTDPNTPDRSYRGYEYLTDHLARNGFATVSISLADLAMIVIGGGIDARVEVLKETITQLKAGTGVPDILAGKLDFTDLSAIGHSRGGEVVPVAVKGGGTGINRGVSIAPTRFAAVAEPMAKKDFLVIYGAYDRDVDNGWPFQLYDAAEGLKFLVFADRANHNFFNRSWAEDEGGGALAVMLKARHEEIARAYTMAFLLDSFRGRQEFREYLLRDTTSLKPPSVGVAAAGLSIQSLPLKTDNRIVDEHDTTVGTNTLGRPVSGTHLSLIRDLDLTGTPSVRNYYQATSAGVVEFSVGPAVRPIYRSQTDVGGGALDVSTFSNLTLRVAQQHGHANNPRTAFDFSVALTDAEGHQSVVDAGALGFVVPPSYRRDKPGGGELVGDPHKSHFKTVRIPLWAFNADGRRLKLDGITDVRLIFDKPRGGRNQGTLGLDDLVFEK